MLRIFVQELLGKQTLWLLVEQLRMVVSFDGVETISYVIRRLALGSWSYANFLDAIICYV
jgi:hypothetical protein